MSIQAPITLGVMAGLMLQPPSHLIKRYGIPRKVVKEAYGSPEARASARRSLRKVRNLCIELGLVTWFTKPIWKALHIWDEVKSQILGASGQFRGKVPIDLAGERGPEKRM